MRQSQGVSENPLVDRTHRTFISYIDRTREYYLTAGFNNPYAWAYFESVPFTRLTKPLAESRIGLVTTAAPYQPENGDQGPHASYNNDAKFHEVYTDALSPAPDLRISHIGYDRYHTVPEDLNAFFPRAQLLAAVEEGRIGSVSERFYGAPTTRSQRKTATIDAPEILRLCREDGVDVAVIPAV